MMFNLSTRMLRVKTLEFELMPYQEDFVFDLEHTDQGFKGGFRAGKSEASVHKAIFLSAIFRGKAGALLSPTYGMTKRNLLPIFRKLARKYNLNMVGLDRANPDSIFIRWGGVASEIFLNITAENHDRLNGVELAWCGLDEADKCLNVELAETCWIQMGTRLSGADNGYNGIRFATSTPEGFGFMYNTFALEESLDKVLYTASMLDNYMLPPGYLEKQLRSIPKHLYKSYIEGEFANIFTSTVYSEFDRFLNSSDNTIEDLGKYDAIHWGCDFNVDKMASVAHGIFNGYPHAIAELTGLKNTPTLIDEIKKKSQGRSIFVYPDASGKNRNPAGLETSIQLLRQANFKVIVNAANPRVGDRINCVNAMFHNAIGERRYKVNSKTCPQFVMALERQGWVNGEPDKSNSINDHVLDAGGYFICKMYPIAGKSILRTM
jgi:hypothetical protein